MGLPTKRYVDEYLDDAIHATADMLAFPADLTDDQLSVLIKTLQTLCGNVIWEEWPDIPAEHQHDEDEFD